MTNKCYNVHFYEQTIRVEATEEAEALFTAMSEVECDSIEEDVE